VNYAKTKVPHNWVSILYWLALLRAVYWSIIPPSVTCPESLHPSCTMQTELSNCSVKVSRKQLLYFLQKIFKKIIHFYHVASKAYYQSKRYCPVLVVQQGGGQCISHKAEPSNVIRTGEPFELIVLAVIPYFVCFHLELINRILVVSTRPRDFDESNRG